MRFPDLVEHLGWGVLENCESLVRVYLPKNLEELPGNAFRKCSSLIDVTLPKHLSKLGSGSFAYCKNIFEIEIPNTVKEIENGVFMACSGLRTIQLPDGITTLRQGLFAQCSNLRNVGMPESLKQIGDMVFFECRNLREIMIPNNTKMIGNHAFLKCSGLTEIWIPGQVQTIGEQAFSECGKLANVVMESGVKDIGERAFFNCRNLKTTVIPSSVKAVGFAAFYNCEKLTIRTPNNSYAYLFAEVNQIPTQQLKWSEKEWARRLPSIREQAEMGNAGAQAILSGYCGTHGKDGNPEGKDLEGQFKWAQKAALQNYPHAFTVLGMMYRNGFYVEKDLSKSLEYVSKGAKLSDPQCQYLLAGMNAKGEGMNSPDQKEFAKWIFAAAENNFLPAITMVTKMAKRYKDGMSTRDLVIGEVIRRAVNNKVADAERLKSDLSGVVDEMTERGDALAKLLHDASELPKLKLAERFMN